MKLKSHYNYLLIKCLFKGPVTLLFLYTNLLFASLFSGSICITHNKGILYCTMLLNIIFLILSSVTIFMRYLYQYNLLFCRSVPWESKNKTVRILSSIEQPYLSGPCRISFPLFKSTFET